MIEVDTVFPSIKIDGREIRFTPKEFDVFVLLYQNRNRICTRDFILDEKWNNIYCTEKAIDVLIGYIRHKLKDTSAEGVIETVRGFGYRLNYRERELFVISNRMGDIILTGDRTEKVDLETIH